MTGTADDSAVKTKELIDCVNGGDMVGVRRLLVEGVPVDCGDESGMTPLQHAAYKGDLEICDLLVKNGANVNVNYHNHGYTALMFAALSGSKEVVKFLLEHGASTTIENSVHRTASQMAGFVGQREIVTLINNFFSQDEIDYFCEARGTETEPKLPRHLSNAVYKFCTTLSLNPIKLTFVLQSMPEVLNSSVKVLKVLELLCEKMMKRKEMDEVMALRFHYLHTVLNEAAKFNSEHNDNLESYLKYLIKGRLSDGFPVNQEVLVRETLRTFPYPECQLMHQAVSSIASEKIGKNMTAISVLQSMINGQRIASDEDKQCSTCGEFKAKACNSCHSVFYCDKRCQKLHWHVHKHFCKQLAHGYEKREMMMKKEEEEMEKERKSIMKNKKDNNEGGRCGDPIKDDGEINKDDTAIGLNGDDDGECVKSCGDGVRINGDDVGDGVKNLNIGDDGGGRAAGTVSN